MIVNIDDILEFVFDSSFEKNKPELAKKIREQERYIVLVNEIRILKEKHQSLEKVRMELREETQNTRNRISGILAKKKK